MTVLPYACRGFHYNNYKYYLEDRFGERVQRLSIEGNFTCPNRDGSLGTGGCIYCNNRSFSPPYSNKQRAISEQISEGIHFLRQRYRVNKFIAYFQNHTNTYGPPSKLEKLYRKALDHPQVIGLAVSTRPDCIEDDVLALLRDISKNFDVNLELGIESLYEHSLQWMNRCHTVETTRIALERASKYNLDVTGHFILGLPSETRDEMMAMATILNDLPLKFIKLHHLQVIKETDLAELYEKQTFPVFTYQEYLEFIALFITQLRPDLILQRVITSSPAAYVIAPIWPQTTTAFIMDLQKYMRENKMYQGDRYSK